MDKAGSIFVSIASYRDPELVPTLLDMIHRAKRPERLHIAVCWQHDDKTSDEIFISAGMSITAEYQHNGYSCFMLSYQDAEISVLNVDFYESQGACWARSMSETFFTEEDFFLQIDSHCRFIENWDEEMVEMLLSLQETSDKPVLSTYPPPYQPDDNSERSKLINRLIFREFDKDGIVMLSSTQIPGPLSVRNSYIAGGFIFTLGSFVREVPSDPQIFFAGEEISTAARAFTNGYDVYAPGKVLLWHFYIRKNHSKVWTDHNNKAKESGKIEKTWWQRDKISKDRIRLLFQATEDYSALGNFKPGNVRTLADFSDSIGVDFHHALVHPDVISPGCISYFSKEMSQSSSWRDTFVRPCRKQLSLNRDQISLIGCLEEQWEVNVFDNVNKLLFSKIYKNPVYSNLSLSEGTDKAQILLNFSVPRNQHPDKILISPYNSHSSCEKTVELSW
ncbi:GlcNAc-transferase family protein [Erwinia amylovora]